MSTQPSRIDVAPRAGLGAPHLALLLAVLAIPGSLLPWDWFRFGGLVIGVPLAVAAIAVAVRARRDGRAPVMTGIAIAIGVAALLIPVVWTIAAVAS